MDSRLNTLGALLLGVVTVALAWLWAYQERQTMQMLQQLLHECEERNDGMSESMVRVYEQYHKAIANVTFSETMNYQYVAQHKDDKQLIIRLQQELAEVRAAQAGRQLTRREDDER